MEAHLEIDKEASPIAHKPRHLAEPLKKWLETGIRESIIEKVPKGEAITCCSPLVLQPKPKFKNQEKLEPHQIRVCIDMRAVNQHMKCNRLVQAPLIEDFAYHFNDCKIFSKLDLRQGYHQLGLDEDSRKVAKFLACSSCGNYRPCRSIFGAKVSQDAFDDIMYRIF